MTFCRVLLLLPKETVYLAIIKINNDCILLHSNLNSQQIENEDELSVLGSILTDFNIRTN